MIASTPNHFGGAVVDSESLPDSPGTFTAELAASLDVWRREEVRVVWLTLSAAQAALVPHAIEAGFTFHHVEKETLQMTLRLDPEAYIPPYATHYIGAGGVVLTEDRRLLVVCERYRRRPGRHYKLPGGALGPGEHIVDAVRREVMEETGVPTRFRSLVCYRHWHGYRHGKSDIYFVCRLDPLSFDLVPQEDEIEEALWMPVDQYLDHPDVHAFNRRIVRAAMADRGIRPEQIDGYGTPETHEFFLPPG